MLVSQARIKPRWKREGRLPRRVLSALALLVTIPLLAAVWTAPAQAGDAGDDRILTAAIYNEAPMPLTFVEGWSQWGWSRGFSNAPTGSSPLFGMIGSPLTFINTFCDQWSNTYNGWFTYRADMPDGTSEYVTISIHGTRKKPTILGCGTGELYPALDVWFTSTAPPSDWRYTSAMPNQIADPQLAYQHNTPYLFDQTITWAGSGPGKGTPAIVSLGDSTISGEGGRWAGNTNGDSSRVDAGAQSYWDTPTGESIPDCHRSKSAEVHIGGGVLSQNFACSGAETSSYSWDYPQGWRFKPGLDSQCVLETPTFTDLSDCEPDKAGQLVQLGLYARTHNVKAVVVAIGANDFDFSDVVKQCAETYVEQLVADTGETCSNQGVISNAITATIRDTIRQKIWTSLQTLTNVMAAAGYDRSQYTVILQNYWSAIPDSRDIRFTNWRDRESQGGCPILNQDADALNNELLPAINGTVLDVAKQFRFEPNWPKIRLLDVSGALNGHRLCEKGVGEIEDYPSFTGNGTDPSMADKLEWVTQMRSASVIGTPYTLAEGGHANYWGQLAERNCLRQVYNNGNPQDGKCVPAPGGGVDSQGEPNMTLQPYTW